MHCIELIQQKEEKNICDTFAKYLDVKIYHSC